MQHTYSDTLSTIIDNLTDAEKAGLPALEKQLINGFLNTGQEVSPANRSKLRFADKTSPHDIAEALKGKNCTVMFGAGKDSSFVLTIARALQIQLLEKYGETFDLRVGIGRHPGMIDCMQTVDERGNVTDGNIEKVLKALDMHDDPKTDIFYIDNKRVTAYSDAPMPADVVEQNRNDVLINGNMWGGAGRRTFCDDCNKNLSRWIATALAYGGGTDLYMTGDSRKELNTQIGTDVPKIIESLGLDANNDAEKLSHTQRAFKLLDQVGSEHTRLAHGDTPEEVELRRIPYEAIDERTRLITVFDQISYDSNKRMPFFHDFLKFDFDSLMFSFTETDCGNPALMCHNIGLIAETIGSSYADGVRAYVEYAIGKMEEKGFAEELIEKMRERYRDDEAIAHMRAKVEDYAKRAYGLEPQHLETMVYAPFTQRGKHLEEWLTHIDDKVLLAHKDEIRSAIAQQKESHEVLDSDVQERLTHYSGLSLKQMRHLYCSPLMMDNLTQEHGSNLEAERFDSATDVDDLQDMGIRRSKLNEVGENDSLYKGKAKVKVNVPMHDGTVSIKEVVLRVMGR